MRTGTPPRVAPLRAPLCACPWIATFGRNDVGEGDRVPLPGGAEGTVVEVYDDENGQEGGVVATLVIEEP